jgi:inositol-phosphate phosphatase/L-galactose 1-phosphate phosphatase/histidinol-phosphatase
MQGAEQFVDLANLMADAAGHVIRPYFRAGVAIDTKSDESPVTIADREAERVMRDLIEAELPGHGIRGEEFGAREGDGEWVWYLDPIDGTKSFICGIPLFGTLIALAHNGTPVLGIIDQPYTHERWIGVAGRQTTMNGRPVRVSSCAELHGARMFTTSMEYYRTDQIAAVERLKAACGVVRYSADCYAFGMLAAGSVDIVVEGGLHEYDVAAVVPVIEGAGGIVTDWDGAPLRFEGQDDVPHIIASGDDRAHRAALELLAGR